MALLDHMVTHAAFRWESFQSRGHDGDNTSKGTNVKLRRSVFCRNMNQHLFDMITFSYTGIMTWLNLSCRIKEEIETR